MDILFCILFCILLFLIIPKYKIEKFNNFKAITVSVSPYVNNPIKIIIDIGDENIFKLLQSKIPFNYEISNSQYNSLISIKKGKIGLINDFMIYEFIYKDMILADKELKKDLRFVCSIKKQYFYLLVPSTSNIYSVNQFKNKKIGMYGKRLDYIYFFELLGYTADTINYKDYDINDKSVLSDFNNKTIDAFFFIGDYPDNILSNFKDYRIIDMKDTNIENPTITMEKRDFTDYGLVGSYKIVNMLTTKGSLYGINNIPNDFIYQFIKTFFNNLEKINGLHNIKTSNYSPDLSGLYKGTPKELATNYKKVELLLYIPNNKNYKIKEILNKKIGIFDNETYHNFVLSDNTFISYNIKSIKNIKGDLDSGLIHGFFISTENKDNFLKDYKLINIDNDIVQVKKNIPNIIIPSNILPSEYNIEIHEGLKKYLDEIGYISDNPNKKCMHFVGTGRCPLSYND